MTAWFAEPSLAVWLIGGMSIVILTGSWLTTGRKELMYGLLAALVLFGGLLALERVLESDREQIKAKLHELADAIEDNDVDTVLAAFHPNSRREREQVRLAMKQFRARRITIKSNLEVDVYADRAPRQARAEFNAVAVGVDRHGLDRERSYPQFVIVDFYQESDDGAWRVETYQLRSPLAGYQRRD